VPVNEQIVWREKEQSGETGKSNLSRYKKALTGIFIIFGRFGTFLWWRGKKLKAQIAILGLTFKVELTY